MIRVRQNHCIIVFSARLRVLHQFAKRLDTFIISLKKRLQEAGIETFSTLVRESWETAKK